MKEEHARNERHGGKPREERRPHLASECKSLPDAERWRRMIIGEISRKISEIQNAGLGEARLRDLNDEINKCIREKGHWEERITGKYLRGCLRERDERCPGVEAIDTLVQQKIFLV